MQCSRTGDPSEWPKYRNAGQLRRNRERRHGNGSEGPVHDDLRAVLEGVAYGDDERITPGDRLRAASSCAPLDGPPPPQTLGQLVAGMSNDELRQYADDYLGGAACARVAARRPRGRSGVRCWWRRCAQRCRHARSSCCGRGWATWRRSRANERAAQLYQAQAFKLAEAHDAAVSGHEAGERGEPAAPGTPAPDGAPEAVSPAPPPGVVPWPVPRRRSPLHRLRGDM